ncbi:uncharacterized protein LOC117304675 [Asterias rubens]|uniref:uncharacterized protein LOC117304675 n=1 Tax=Asterias rubens TaxID=7604 RepID=UPI00145567E1|nr:uncharacterized protein LOC117304675 [Asterias rubens]
MSQVAKDLTTASLEEIVKCLNLTAHPEGGFYTESYRCDRKSENGQSHCSAIYYLMTKEHGLAWHKLNGLDEMFHFYAGAPVEISLASPEGAFLEKKICGLDIFGGQRPQVLVPADHWQSAKCLGEWTLYGVIVSPGFEIQYSEQAPDGWKPTGI